ncbi:YqiA/YcfP family alpha/beta fold hydrolase [Pararobbsia silviterrae]|uniref:Esterase n=1 Tax=Pararobbsia silviterrae TaxID=1792498 RepID=A0A494XCI0_9BURK|nr:YqiA/YcfP family alpha/beta fold hydrolase [Pararobbsia silviterrae]RKP48557.1 esterase [Pararobbsia silviterrae]
MIVYLHGFRSSPQSFKARLLAHRLTELGHADRWRCPALPVSPAESIALVERELRGVPADQVSLIGSSLGGYYATYLAERHGYRAVLVNPATDPGRDLSRYLGEQPLWHGGGSIVVEARHLDEFKTLAVASITRPERYYLIAATGDEVLDYRDMLKFYAGAKTTLIDGGDHGLSDFGAYCDRALAFCGIV